MIKKLIVSLLTLLLLTACSGSNHIIKEANSSIVNLNTLLSNTDGFLKIKVLDDLSIGNSFYETEDGLITNFHSKRKIEVLDDFDTGIKLEEIFVSEAKIDGNLYQYSNNRSLNKGGIYLVYLTKSNETNEYFVPNYQGAIVDLEKKFVASTPDVTLTDFYSLLNASGKDSSIYQSARYIPGIKDPISVESFNVTVGNQSLEYSIASLGNDKLLLEINSVQYEVVND